MNVPNCETAFIPISKIEDYLLSESHSVGKSKAKFFRLCGFNETNTSLFEEELLYLVRSQDYQDKSSSPFGEKYIERGSINTPFRGEVEVKSIWIIEPVDSRPRFVTAYPD